MTATHISDRQLIELHVDALFTHGQNGRICRVNEPAGGRAPRFFLSRTRECNLWRIRDDMPDGIARRLEELAASEPIGGDLRSEPRNLSAFQAALGDAQGSRPVHYGPAYRFPDELTLPMHSAIQIGPPNVHLVEMMGYTWHGFGLELAAREPCWAAIEDSVAISVCFSARLTEHVAEAGVETLELYRRKGHAHSVVSIWAQTVRAMGRIPLYSTSWENRASQAIAHRLGLIQYAVDLSL